MLPTLLKDTRMRGPDEQTKDMFSYLSPEQRVRPMIPLRGVRRMTDDVLQSLCPGSRTITPDISAGRRFRPSSCSARCGWQGPLHDRSERLLRRRSTTALLSAGSSA